MDDSSCSVNGGYSDAGKAERGWSLSLSTQKSELCPQEHGLSSPEDRVCLSPNTGRNYCQTEEEGKEQPVVATQNLTSCDRSEESQSEAEKGSLSVGIPPPAACGKHAEETDRGEAVIREGQEATEEKDGSKQEAGDSTGRGREEEKETDSVSGDTTTLSGDTAVSVMGQTRSSEGLEVSDTECSQEEENAQTELIQHNQELCKGFSLNEEKPGNEELTDLTLTPVDLPNPSLIDCGDVMQEAVYESAVPCLLIEGLHEGEPPPDINSLEQNQETAGRDYSTEQQWSLADGRSHLAPEIGCHSGEYSGTASGKVRDILLSTGIHEPPTIPGHSLPVNEPDILEETSVSIMADFHTARDSMENTWTDPASCQPSPEVNSSGNRHADLDSWAASQSLSSDEDDSFRSVESSTTEIFHSVQDNDKPTMEERDLNQTKIVEQASVEFNAEEQNDINPVGSNGHSKSMDSMLHSEHGTDSAMTVTACGQPGTEPESQLSPSLHIIEPLSPDGTVQELSPELSKGDLSLGPAYGETPGVKVSESRCESGEASGTDPNVEHSVSEVTASVSVESIADESKVTGQAEEDTQPAETSDETTAASTEESLGMDVHLVQEQHSQEVTADEPSPETHPHEGLRRSEIQTTVAFSKCLTSSLSTVDVSVVGAESPLSKNGTSSEPPAEDLFSPEGVMENPMILDTVDGPSENHTRPMQGGKTQT